MITNEYIRGYLAALRGTQVTFEALEENMKKDKEEGIDFPTSLEILDMLKVYIIDQRKTYKELVDVLNEQNELRKK